MSPFSRPRRPRWPGRPGARAARLLLLAVIGLRAVNAFGIDRLWLEIGDLEASFGSAEGVRLALEPDRNGGAPAVSLHARAVLLPAPLGPLTDVRIACPALVSSGGRFACRDAKVVVGGAPVVGAQELRADVTYDTASGKVEIHARGLDFARANVDVDLLGMRNDWTVFARGNGLDAASLGELAHETGLLENPPEIAGQVDVEVRARGDGNGLDGANSQIGAAALSGSDESGRLAVEGLGLSLDLGLQAENDGWAFELEAKSDSGQLYVEPWFVEPGEAALEVSARGEYTASAVALEEWSFRQDGVLAASGSASIAPLPEARVQRARVHIAEARFPEAYRIWLQPYLYGGALDALATSGRMEGEIVLAEQGAQRIALTAHDLSIDDTGRRFAVYGLNGSLHWDDGGAAVNVSRLSWDGGFVFGIGFGAAGLAAETGGRAFRLLEPLALPVLDGSLLVRELAVSRFGLPELEIAFDAELEPLDMRALTAALDWPSLSGQLSGRIPDLSYADGAVTLGGDLTADVFGGTITVGNLRLRDPFGTLPRLAADVRLRGLNLESVTNTFEIGRIEGGLDGDIENLRLFRWTPIAFDARLYTPPDDELRHRISQRAVESISSLGGGGATAALSSGFLQFFENFAYARLGLGCRLRNGVCHMQGVGPAPTGGYYIVEGKWLPRIDVIGHAELVDWPVLLEQLSSLAEADAVVVR
ncbi:MAG: hypothetical protein ACREVN_04715 [Gammaproteobacteria bacterium]